MAGIFSGIFKGSTNQTQANMEDTTTSGSVSEASSSSSSITEDKAMQIAALYQGVNIISDTIASMPIYLYKDDNGFQQTFPMDQRSSVLTDMANPTLTAYNLKKNLIKDLILHGNAYAKIVREGDKVSLEYLPTDIVTPKKDSTGYYFQIQSYSTGVMGESVSGEVVDYGDMLVLIRNPKYNSVVGQGLLTNAADILNVTIEETNYMINLFKNGLSAKAVLNSKTPFKKEVKEQLKADLKNFYSGQSNAGKMMVLEGDISILPLSLTPTDVKLIETKHFSISEIARFLNIPKHMLSLDRQQGTYSNITQERLQLLQNTLTPYVVAVESGINSKLLTEEEKANGYYFQFNTMEMLKLTPEDQARYMLDLYRENIVTLEEVRSALNLGGDIETLNQLKQYDILKSEKLKKDLASESNVIETEDATLEESTEENVSDNEKAKVDKP